MNRPTDAPVLALLAVLLALPAYPALAEKPQAIILSGGPMSVTDRLHDLDRTRRVDVAVGESVRQHHEIRCEAVTPDVRALPGLLGPCGCECGGHWTSVDGAALVVPALSADEVGRLARGR